jgi:CubicO group peptidase (beta-lactamase class C family)
MAQFAVPGMGVTVVEEWKIESRGYGVKEVDGEAVTPETLFQACSISKPVTAVAVVRLAQEGVLDLDEDVNSYLTSWKVPKTVSSQPRITLRQLLGHVAGTSTGSLDMSPTHRFPRRSTSWTGSRRRTPSLFGRPAFRGRDSAIRGAASRSCSR